MFGSKALNLFLLALTLSAAPAATSAIKSPALLRQQDSGVRGRSLKNGSKTNNPGATSAPSSGSTEPPKKSHGNELPSVASSARSTASSGTKKTKKGSRSAVVAPSKRSCVTSTFLTASCFSLSVVVFQTRTSTSDLSSFLPFLPLEQDKGSVKFECKAATTTASNIHDNLIYQVAVNNGRSLQIGVNYQSIFQNATTNSSSQNTNTTSYTLVYDRIIEYRNNASSSDGHYVWGADEIVNSYPLNNWNSLTPVTTNGTLLTFSATDGLTTFNFTISEADTVNLTVNGMKIDFLVENYPWDPAGDTYLALISHILTHETINAAPSGPAGSSGPGGPGGSLGPKDVQVKDVTISFNSLNGGSSSSQSKALGFTPFGAYTWADTAEATTYGINDTNNGTTATSRSTLFGNDTTVYSTSTIQVIASTDPNATQEAGPGNRSYHEIAFSFVGAAKGADRIYWDPTVSVGYSAGVTARGIGSLVAAVVASVAFCFAI